MNRVLIAHPSAASAGGERDIPGKRLRYERHIPGQRILLFHGGEDTAPRAAPARNPPYGRTRDRQDADAMRCWRRIYLLPPWC